MVQKLFPFITILLLVNIAGWAQSVQMRVCNKDGTVHVFNLDEVRKLTFAGVNSGIDDPKFNTVIKNFSLLKNHPNPFSKSTTVSYILQKEGPIEIMIVDLNGKVIKTLPAGNQSPGEHSLIWDGITNTGNKAQTGIYFCKVKFNNQIQTNKMILIK